MGNFGFEVKGFKGSRYSFLAYSMSDVHLSITGF